MAIIRKYNFKDLGINKNEINQEFFKDNKNSKILDIFNGIKTYLSDTDYSIEDNDVNVIFTDGKNIHNNGKKINSSSLKNTTNMENIAPFSFDMISNSTLILSKGNKDFNFDKKSVIFSEIVQNILNLNFKNLKIINAINALSKTKNKNLETYNLGSVLFHEIGHYVQSAWQSKNKLPTDSADIQGLIINSLTHPSYAKDNMNVDVFTYGLDFLDKPQNRHNFLGTTFSESFADVFSLMMTDQFYPSNISDAIQDRIIKNREIEHNSATFFKYHSVGAMKEYMDIKDQVKDLNINEKVSLAVKISTKQAFNTFVNVFNNQIEELTKLIRDDENFIENKNNKNIIQKKIETISYLGGVLFPDGDLNSKSINTIATKLESEIGLKGIKEFLEKKQVQDCFDSRISNFITLYGESKRYFIERMTNSNNIVIKPTLQENYEYIENKILELKSLNVLKPQSLTQGIILRENTKRINLIIDSMIQNKMLSHKEAEMWLFEGSKNYGDLIYANAKANKVLRGFINEDSKPKDTPHKKTFKEKIKEKLYTYIPERKEIPANNNLKKKI